MKLQKITLHIVNPYDISDVRMEEEIKNCLYEECGVIVTDIDTDSDNPCITCSFNYDGSCCGCDKAREYKRRLKEFK